jgi:thiol-disulfide isomerase/thioredoxin
MKTYRNLLLFATAFAGLMASSLFAAEGWNVGDTLPDISRFGLSEPVPDLRGRVVYLDFCASWCAPCKASFPVLNTWQKELGGRGFVILGVSVDEEAPALEAFLKKTPTSFPVVRDSAHKLVSAANVKTMPTSFLVDRKGIIRHVHSGFHKKDEAALLAQINALL